MEEDLLSVTTEDVATALSILNSEKVRRYYIRHREEILQRRHEHYFKKKRLRKIPERQPHGREYKARVLYAEVFDSPKVDVAAHGVENEGGK